MNQLGTFRPSGCFIVVFKLLDPCGMILRSLTESPRIGGCNETRGVGQTSINSGEGLSTHSHSSLRLVADRETFNPPRFVVPFLNPLTVCCV